MIPYDQMTEEEFIRTFPDWSITTECPGYYPHFDKQPGLTKQQRLDIQKKHVDDE
jgi:hypothetical protein